MRVLHIEDDTDVASATERMLRIAYDAKVVNVDTAEGAISLLDADERFDVIISDFNLRIGTGGEIVEWLRLHDPEMVDRFFFVSGNERCLRYRPVPWLDKPASPQAIRELVERLTGLARATEAP